MNDETRLSTNLPASDQPTVLSPSSEHAAVLSSSSAWSSRGSSASQPSAGASDALRLADGQTFGAYTIVQLLGRGGMGEVYEATHNATGKRVALKLLRGRIDFGPERQRFLQEGRLAASLSHPHTVYVLGSDEIDGLPVITMQLVPGGTLKDRVSERGPMPVADAVAAVLDVISGLDAAASAGILHRDIKPSNCFVDANGAVKVGDFGLSISTSASDRQGGFQGTPQYAPPEQFSGATLDVRADIYAVGATLFFLLTGRAPFDGSDVTELIERVKRDAAPLAHTVQSRVPHGLSAVIARCLAKDPSERPSSYPELVDALRPFSATTGPARPGVRLVAWAIDAAVIGAVSGILGSIVDWGHASTFSRSTGRGDVSVNVDPIPVLVSLLYYALTECRTGVSLGKRLFGLRVVSVQGERTWAQMFKRTLVFFGGNAFNVVAALLFGPNRFAQFAADHVWMPIVVSAGPMLGLAAQLVPMRRRNGFMGLHDWLTGTRVVQRQRDELRRRDETAVTGAVDMASGQGRRTLGPFTVLGELAETASGTILNAFDPVLKRRVWILEPALGAPETSRARREVDRIGRLHWLAGQRTSDECWDAFEAPEGAPLDPKPSSVPWSRARLWLADLAAELVAAEQDGTTPVLALDRVWVRPDGRAVLLDWPAPGAAIAPALPAASWLEQVGRLAMGYEGATPVPVSAVAMLDRWHKRPQLAMADLRADLTGAAMSPDEVSRGRRYVPLLASAVPVILLMIAGVIATAMVSKMVTKEVYVAQEMLGALESESDAATRDALAASLAGHYKQTLQSKRTWKVKIGGKNIDTAKLEALAATTAALTPSAEELRAADEKVRAVVARAEADYDRDLQKEDSPGTIMSTLLFVGAGMSFSVGLMSVVIRPSGLLMATLGLAVLTRRGREVSRWRAIWRLMVAWSPVGVYAILCAVPVTQRFFMAAIPASIVSLVMLAGVVWTFLRPTRGPHDRLCGTEIGVR